jgi:hypothetical protein
MSVVISIAAWGPVLERTELRWPLQGGGKACLIGRSLVGKRPAKCLFPHPDKAMGIGNHLRLVWMRLVPIKNLPDWLVFIGREGSNIDQRLHSLLPHRGDHGA